MKSKVLVVDDELSILNSLERLLRRDGCEIVKAEGGRQAIETLDEHKDLALIICDQRMPGRTGIEVLKAMRELEPGTIRILITGYSDIDVVIQAVNETVLHRYVTKPWVNEDLIEVVAEGARQYIDESGLAGDKSGILF